MNTIFDNMNTVSSLPKHDYVDLGLPSGTLWATENIKDANGNELYFAWGETCGYTAEQVKGGKFDWDDYDFAPANWDDETNYGIKKYNKTDGLMILEPKDDAATVNWGEEWKTPTNEQFEELMAYTKYEWVEIDGVSGGKFTSTVEGYTDKFVFFPAVGYADDGEVDYVGQDGNYWSSSMYRFIGIDIGGALWLSKGLMYYYLNRCYGCPVRPVRTQGIDRTQDPEVAQVNEITEGTQDHEGTQGDNNTQVNEIAQGSEGTQGA